jgi:perosamine synthetase
MKKREFKIPFFRPNVTTKMKQAVYGTLGQKIITQGQTVLEFEKKLESAIGVKNVVSVNSGTSALELAYTLMDLRPGDEVITPVFSFIGTNILLVRRGVKIVFADINENMLLDWTDVAKKITPKTRAIVNVHLFNQLNKNPSNVDVPIIGDAAQYLGKTSGERFTIHSFQATKIITTIDGGALICRDDKDYRRAKLLRWYGVDRETSKNNIEVDIFEAGYKYHMNNVTAAMGLAALSLLPKAKAKISHFQNLYFEDLKNIPGLKAIGGSPFLVHVEDRENLIKKLAEKGIETGFGHRRNDIYTIFGGKRLNLPNMNRYEKTHLLLPCRANMTTKEARYICHNIKRICR